MWVLGTESGPPQEQNKLLASPALGLVVRISDVKTCVNVRTKHKNAGGRVDCQTPDQPGRDSILSTATLIRGPPSLNTWESYPPSISLRQGLAV